MSWDREGHQRTGTTVDVRLRLGCKTRWKLRGSGPPGSGPGFGRTHNATISFVGPLMLCSEGGHGTFLCSPGQLGRSRMVPGFCSGSASQLLWPSGFHGYQGHCRNTCLSVPGATCEPVPRTSFTFGRRCSRGQDMTCPEPLLRVLRRRSSAPRPRCQQRWTLVCAQQKDCLLIDRSCFGRWVARSFAC